MRLKTSIPAFEQIKVAIENGVPLAADLRSERMGDACAALAVAQWISGKSGGSQITCIQDPQGKTGFMLNDFVTAAQITCELYPAGVEIPFLDVHTCGLNDSLWILNPYLTTQGEHPKLKLKEPLQKKESVVFAPLINVEYNNRREMDIDNCNLLISELEAAGHSVIVMTEDAELFPKAPKIGLKDCIKFIAECKLFIGGDTGFSHVCAALGTKQVAIYPDWFHCGMADLRSAVVTAEWWGIPTTATPKNFLPNAPADKIRVVELGTDHKFSTAHVLDAVNTLLK